MQCVMCNNRTAGLVHVLAAVVGSANLFRPLAAPLVLALVPTRVVVIMVCVLPPVPAMAARAGKLQKYTILSIALRKNLGRIFFYHSDTLLDDYYSDCWLIWNSFALSFFSRRSGANTNSH